MRASANMTASSWTRRRLGLVVLAAVGASLLAVIAASYWSEPNDNLAYWLAGQRIIGGGPVYAIGDAAFAPYAYHYPPPLAQLLAPLTVMIPTLAYLIVYRALEILVTWDLAGRRMLPMLALIAVLPVAVELRFENVHLFVALGIVVGLRRWPWLFAVGAVVKLSPGLGVVYLACRRRWRDALVASVAGLVMAGASWALAPDLWQGWLNSVVDRADVVGNSLLPVPYLERAAVGLALAVAGGALGRRRGELLLVAGITVANPGLAVNGLAVLAAALPIWLAGPAGVGDRAEGHGSRSIPAWVGW
jgi:Glycosyltransferase family 87